MNRAFLANFLQQRPRELALVVGLIAVAGCVGLVLLPRMEDPRLTPRAARIITLLPGASAERVESLVTEKLETAIREIEEVKEIISTSSANVSFVAVELNDEVNESEAENVWTRIRDKASEAHQLMPPDTLAPQFKKFDITASAMILGLRWDDSSPPNYAILSRLAKELKDLADSVPGTEKSELFGAPVEEILVTVDAHSMTSLGITAQEIAQAIGASDAKVSAGQLRTNRENVQFEVAGELDTLRRLSLIPIQFGDASSFTSLGDIATIEKAIKLPLDSKVLSQGKTTIAVGIQIEPQVRIDLWAGDLENRLAAFEAQLPRGVVLETLFEQEKYVSDRMQNLLNSLVFSAITILVVIYFMMGWRSAIVVGSALPLTTLMVLACMYWMGIPIHQMSITGLIIALGLLIDNAIIVVDEIAKRIHDGANAAKAVSEGTSFLFMPLLGSTVTTVLSLSPIILMEGPAGEFVGSIALVAAIAIILSFGLAITVVAAFTGLGFGRSDNSDSLSGDHGVSFSWLARLFGRSLDAALAYPLLGLLAGVSLPVLGFVGATTLEEQFFPPADRAQFQLELELAPNSALDETERYAEQIRQSLLSDPRIEDVHWFLGESAPMFYYNVIPIRSGTPQYGQAIVDCKPGVNMRELLQEKQRELSRTFPAPTILVRQLEQGPPFDAPIEVLVSGPDIKQLRELGDELRRVLHETSFVHHTRANLSDTSPRISFQVDEQQARLARLDHRGIANELNSSLEGVTGGSLLEGSEELAVRVRVSGELREDLNQIASLDLLSRSGLVNAASPVDASFQGVPITAIAEMRLEPELVSITRKNGERINEVQAFIDAGVLPAIVLEEFRERLETSDFVLPFGYAMTFGGAEEERSDAIRALVGNLIFIVVLMIAALVVSTGSFRMAGLLFVVAGLSIGLGFGSLWLAGYPWGFMSMVAMMGMVGVAVNDSIIVLASIQSLPKNLRGDRQAIRNRVLGCSRHVLSTTLTTIVGFAPLFVYGGEFWSPVAIAISGGVGGATLIALYMIPCAYLLVMRPRSIDDLDEPPPHEEWDEEPRLALVVVNGEDDQAMMDDSSESESNRNRPSPR